MQTFLRFAVAALFIAAAAGGAVYWISTLDARPGAPRPMPTTIAENKSRATTAAKPEAPKRADLPIINQDSLDDSGVAWAHEFTGAISDPSSLRDIRDAIAARSTIGLAVLRAELSQVHLNAQTPPERLLYAARLGRSVGMLLLYEGRFEEAEVAFQNAQAQAESGAVPGSEALRDDLTVLRGITALRRGETDNCVACLGPSSCIFPIASEAAHTRTAGSREAIDRLSEYLAQNPGDLRARWVLNIANMTLDQYPAKVPPAQLIPLDVFRSKADVGRFENVAGAAGLIARGPNQAGGSVFDDFTGDGLPDIFSTSLDADLGASMLVNQGDGTFADRSEGLGDQVYVLNLARADYDNDGDLDLVLLRGGWDVPMRLTLLRNRGDGRFDDVTLAAGMGTPISTESAAWGDYDNDGSIDLFVCGELRPPGSDPATFQPDPRNHSRLYRNRGDGTFEDMAAKLGLGDDGYAKGAAWGDFDADGRLDLFVSNMDGPSRLYHQDAQGQFQDVAAESGTAHGFGFACWAWDFDNDGKLDIYVNGKGASLAATAAYALGIPPEYPSYPHLYKNLGNGKFRDVAKEAGLHVVMTPMGCNFGDIDDDGYQDLYLGTGGMSYSHLVPNLMFKNVGGKAFADATLSSGTGHLQKGHGVSFADYDGDGDLDLFAKAGGASPGDRAHNLLFRNPGHNRHWLNLKLVGTKTNRAAIGAEVTAEIKHAGGSMQVIHRTIGNNSSFGGNSLVEHLGLGDAATVAKLTIRWPTSDTTQTFEDVVADRAVKITEGTDEVRPLRAP